MEHAGGGGSSDLSPDYLIWALLDVNGIGETHRIDYLQKTEEEEWNLYLPKQLSQTEFLLSCGEGAPSDNDK
jgi:hypothetical protein